MNRADADRLWAHVQTLLRAPAAPDHLPLRRAARLLAASRSDAVELLLAHWLAETADAAPVPAAPATAATGTDPATPAAPTASPGLRDAALLTAGAAAGVAGALLLG